MSSEPRPSGKPQDPSLPLVAFFTQVAKKDQDHLKKLQQEACFSLVRDRWCFTLPDLHLFVQRQAYGFSDMDYRQFRQLIFSSPINQVIKQHGAEIQIIDNRSKVDQSIYALVWLENVHKEASNDAPEFPLRGKT